MTTLANLQDAQGKGMRYLGFALIGWLNREIRSRIDYSDGRIAAPAQKGII